MGWKDLLEDAPPPIKRRSGPTLTTQDLQEPYDIVDVVFVSNPVYELTEMLSHWKDRSRGQDIGSESFQAIKDALRARAEALRCDAVIGVTISYTSQATVILMTGTGTAVRTHRVQKEQELAQRAQQAAPINPGQLLVRAQLPQYIATFSKHGLSAARIPVLVESDLISAGITDAAHRHTILTTIRAILAEQDGG